MRYIVINKNKKDASSKRLFWPQSLLLEVGFAAFSSLERKEERRKFVFLVTKK